MIVTFFNEHPRSGLVSPDLLINNIGKEVDLINNEGVAVGKAKILDLFVTAYGVEVTYETDLRIDISLVLNVGSNNGID